MTLELRRMMAGAALALLLGLPGCNGERKQTAAPGTAGGEVLEASVSDAMLPVDRVRSQAPLAPRTEAAKGGRRASESGSEAEGDIASVEADAEAGAGEAPPPPPPPPTPGEE